MLNQEQQQFLRNALKEFINQYEEYLNNLKYFSFFKKNEYKSLIIRFKNLLIKLDDNKDVLKKMSMGEIATLRNISLDILDKIKNTPNAQENKDLIIKATFSMECLTELSKELSEIQ